MGLLQKCCETYDNHSHLVGVTREVQVPLVPIAHVLKKNADIEITIDRNGKFVTACSVPKEDGKTIVPATIESASRTNKPVAHPLCDKLGYMLSTNSKKYADYMSGLRKWSDSPYGFPKLKAVINYLESGSIVGDLCSCKVIKGSLDKKEQGLFIRWRIEGFDDDAECWHDKKMFASWIDYYLNSLGNDKDLCMVTGENVVVTDKHPKGIIEFEPNAKLISSNDNTNFTFRGRFLTAADACTVGYVVSQKAHNVLSWQAARGYVAGKRVFMCWNPKGFTVPDLLGDLKFPDTKVEETDYREELSKTIKGYKLDLPDNEDVVVASIQAATQGRVSLTYYNELKASDFLERLNEWYSTCCWFNGKLGIQSPPIYKIVRCAYGVERSDYEVLVADDGICRDIQQRLLSCILDNVPISYDIVRSLVLKASNPENYDRFTKRNYEELLFVACAVIRKYLNDKCRKENWTLNLDVNKTERSYLFGRLLAIFEKAETDAYERMEKKHSVPNAIRLQSAYCERPFHYLSIIHNSLTPYFLRLGPGLTAYYKNMISEIMEKLAEIDPKEINKPLSGTYLLGYYLQRNDFYKSKKNDKTEE